VFRGVFNGTLHPSDELIAKIKIYKQRVVNPEFRDRRTTREDIDEANTLIDEVIAELEK